MSCSGSSSGATVTQLMSKGSADAYLTQDPTITFWRFKYSKHSNFAMEAIEQPFGAQPQFGGDVQVILNKTGDLIYYQYVLIDLPGIVACEASAAVCGIGGNNFPCCDPCDPCGDGAEPVCGCPTPTPVTSSVQEEDLFVEDQDSCTGLTRPWAHYTNAIGQFVVKRACLTVGGQTIDTLYNDYLFAWEELSGKAGKRLTEMIGKRFTRAQLVQDSKRNRRLYVPLPWWFTQTPGNAYPMVSAQFHAVQLNMTFETLARSIQVSDCDVAVTKCNDCQPLLATDLMARMLTTYIYLDCEERNRFASSCFEQLISQVQTFQTCIKGCNANIQLNFNNPMIELIWMVRRKCNELCNSHFNYSGKWGRDPINNVTLRFNNNSRLGTCEGKYYRLVEPYQSHSSIPEAFIYSYSFALFPEQAQPSGSANFSRIDNVEMQLSLQSEMSDEDVSIIVFGRSWNVMRYREGLAGLSFS